jgi:hypothetical protein
MQVYCDQINNDTAKMAFYISKSTVTYIKYLKNCSGIFMEQRWIKRPAGFALDRNSILFRLVEDILQHTIATGIPQHLKKYHEDFILKIDPVVEDDEPKVLTMEDLSFGFNIVLIALGVSTIVFVLEVLYFRTKKFIVENVRKIIGNVFVLLLLKQWLKRYHI